MNDLQRIIMHSVCSSTVNGWLWYCDAHDTHGNADTHDEAKLTSQTHLLYWKDDPGDEPCDLFVWYRATDATHGPEPVA